MADAIVEAFRLGFDLTAIERIQIHVENLGAVERHFDFLAADFQLLIVPLSDGTQVARFATDAMIQRSVILIRLQMGVGMFGVVTVVVNDLNLKAVG